MMAFKESFLLWALSAPRVGCPQKLPLGSMGCCGGMGLREGVIPNPCVAVNAAALLYQAAAIPRASLTGGGKLPLQSRGWRLLPLPATYVWQFEQPKPAVRNFTPCPCSEPLQYG